MYAFIVLYTLSVMRELVVMNSVVLNSSNRGGECGDDSSPGKPLSCVTDVLQCNTQCMTLLYMYLPCIHYSRLF